MTGQFSFGNQIIDVTRDCNFYWVEQPSSCKPYIEVSNATGDFTDDEIISNITDGSSTAKVFDSYVEGGRVYLYDVSGNFNSGDQIQGNTSGQTAIVSAYVDEKQWPASRTHGSFPSSIVSPDLDDYLEFETASDSSGYVARLGMHFPPGGGWYIVIPVFGVGDRIANKYDSGGADKEVLIRIVEPYSDKFCVATTGGTSQYNQFFGLFNGFMGYVSPEQSLQFFLRHKGRYVFRWRIHHIKVLKLSF